MCFSAIVLLALALVVTATGCRTAQPPTASVVEPPLSMPTPTPSIDERVARYGPEARARLAPYFAAAGVAYPPARFLLLGLKRERELQVYAESGIGAGFAYIRTFPVLAASGGLGPKLREGDRQVPEGVYRIVYLNPNSVAHLSLALDYPNPFDRAHADEDGRAAALLGGEIMIHGGSGSIGCLAVGDRAAEDLFVLAADSDWQRSLVVISPVDFRRAGLPAAYDPAPEWVGRLYSWLRRTLRTLPPPVASREGAASAR